MNNILETIFVYLFYIGIFSIIYIFTWGIFRNYFAKFEMYYQILIGGIFGVLVVLAQSLIPNFMSDFKSNMINIYLPILIFWLVGVFISWKSLPFYMIAWFTGSFAVLPKIIQNYKVYLVGNQITLLSVLLVLTSISVILGAMYHWSKWTVWSSITLSSFIFSSLMVLVRYKSNTIQSWLYEELDVLLWIAFSYLIYGIAYIIELIYIHAVKLQNIIKYDRTTYIREALAHEALYSYIHEHKIQLGIYFTFEIKSINKLDNLLDSKVKSKIIDIVSREVFNLWQNKEVLFFKASLSHFGIFMPLYNNNYININDLIDNNALSVRHEEDILHTFEQLLENVRKKFIVNNYLITIDIQGYASIYGIHSNNLDKLKSYNLLYSENTNIIDFKGKVLCVDPKIISKIYLQHRSIMALNDQVDLGKVISLFYPIVNIDNKYLVEYNYSTNLVNGNNTDFQTKELEFPIDNYQQTTLVRYNAALNIKNYTNYFSQKTDLENRVFVQYAANFLGSENFNLKRFMNKLIEYKIKPRSLVLTFDLRESDYDSRKLQENLDSLKKVGIKIAVKNIGAKDTSIVSLAHYEPEFGIIDPYIIREMSMHPKNKVIIEEIIRLANKLEITLIAPHVNSLLTYNKLKQLGLQYMFGTVFGTNNEPQLSLSNDVKFILLKNEREVTHALKK